MTTVKICGIKRVEDARVAIDSGADMLGFVFAPSTRQIIPETARDIIAAVRPDSAVRAVGVFVNAEPDEMNRIAGFCDLDFIQLSGDEPDDLVARLNRPVIKAIHVGDDDRAEVLRELIRASGAEVVLVDTARAGKYGGTGEALQWDRLPVLDRPVLLAGGLEPANVAEAIRIVRPWGVDVSSGVETNGEKDHEKIGAFVRAARG